MNPVVFLLILGLVTLSVQEGEQGENGGNGKHGNHEKHGWHGKHGGGWIDQGCLNETKTNEADVKKALKGEEVPSKETKCYFECSMKKKHTMDGSGAINLKSIRDRMPDWADKAKYNAMVDECEKSSGSDTCDTAYQASKCVKTKFWNKGGQSE